MSNLPGSSSFDIVRAGRCAAIERIFAPFIDVLP